MDNYCSQKLKIPKLFLLQNQDNEKKPGDGGADFDRESLTLQCVPFYSVLLALGKYLSILNFSYCANLLKTFYEYLIHYWKTWYI